MLINMIHNIKSEQMKGKKEMCGNDGWWEKAQETSLSF